MDDQTLAGHLILSHVLDELSKADPKTAAAIKKGLDKAADAAEVIAMREPNSKRGQSSLRILEFVEEFRSMTLGRETPPSSPRQI